MKSLWTGTVFLLGVTWLEKRQLGFKWLLIAIAISLAHKLKSRSYNSLIFITHIVPLWDYLLLIIQHDTVAVESTIAETSV